MNNSNPRQGETWIAKIDVICNGITEVKKGELLYCEVDGWLTIRNYHFAMPKNGEMAMYFEKL